MKKPSHFISFVKSLKPIEVPPQANLMQSLLENGRPVGSSCGGEGICGQCGLRIAKGHAELAPPSPLERATLEKKNAPPDTRLSCQVQVCADLVVDADYW